MRPLRFGLMCRGPAFDEASADCLRQILALEGVELALVIVDETPVVYSGWRERLVKVLTGRGLLWGLHQRLLSLSGMASARPVDVTPELAGVERLRCRITRRGRYTQLFDPADVEAIRARDLDFLLKFAFGIIRGDILEAARHGVWSFHHGDEARYRGSPAGFWEVHDGAPTTGAILQRLTDRLDGGVVLERASIRTRPTYRANYEAIIRASTGFPARACRRLQAGDAVGADRPSPTRAPIRRTPNDAQVLVYLARLAARFLNRQARFLLYTERWNVGLVDAPIERFLEPGFRPRIRWFPPPAPTRFLADPFAVPGAAGPVVLAEDYDDRRERARITEFRLAGDRVVESRPAIDGPGHLSYPCLFVDGERVLCAPESAIEGRIDLYRRVAGGWRREGTLLEGVPAVDPTVFRHGGRWWLLCARGDDEPLARLFGWHAERPEGPWTPHRLDPLKTDIATSRPAGPPFEHGGQLYRPAQDCSRTYGGAVVILRVDRLTPDAFAEVPVARLEPERSSRYPDGRHTLAAAGPRTLVDGKRHALASWLIRRKARHKLERLRRAVSHAAGATQRAVRARSAPPVD